MPRSSDEARDVGEEEVRRDDRTRGRRAAVCALAIALGTFSPLLSAALGAAWAFPFGTWARGNVAQLGLEVPARAKELMLVVALTNVASIAAVWLGARGLGLRWWWAVLVMIPVAVLVCAGEPLVVRYAIGR